MPCCGLHAFYLIKSGEDPLSIPPSQLSTGSDVFFVLFFAEGMNIKVGMCECVCVCVCVVYV